jgi:hypothetical protein
LWISEGQTRRKLPVATDGHLPDYVADSDVHCMHLISVGRVRRRHFFHHPEIADGQFKAVDARRIIAEDERGLTVESADIEGGAWLQILSELRIEAANAVMGAKYLHEAHNFTKGTSRTFVHEEASLLNGSQPFRSHEGSHGQKRLHLRATEIWRIKTFRMSFAASHLVQKDEKKQPRKRVWAESLGWFALIAWTRGRAESLTDEKFWLLEHENGGLSIELSRTAVFKAGPLPRATGPSPENSMQKQICSLIIKLRRIHSSSKPF